MNLSRKKFAATVDAAVETVRRLYKEVYLLDRELSEELRKGDPPLRSVGSLLRSPRGTKERQEDMILKGFYGRVLAQFLPEEPSEVEEDDREGEEEEGTKERKTHILRGNESHVFYKIVLYEKTRKIDEPYVLSGQIHGFTVGSADKASAEAIPVRRRDLNRLLDDMDAGLPNQLMRTHIRPKGKGRKKTDRLSLRVGSIKTKPLYEFHSEEDIGAFAKGLRKFYKLSKAHMRFQKSKKESKRRPRGA